MSICFLGATLFSCIAFLLYGWDKRQARLDRWRVPEHTLHLIGVLGGWPGGLLGQQMFRHKTRKIKFQVMFWMTVILHVGLCIGLWFRLPTVLD